MNLCVCVCPGAVCPDSAGVPGGRGEGDGLPQHQEHHPPRPGRSQLHVSLSVCQPVYLSVCLWLAEQKLTLCSRACVCACLCVCVFARACVRLCVCPPVCLCVLQAE